MKIFYKVLATACAMVFIVASPMASMTTHAIGFNWDGQDDTDYGEMPDNYWDNSSTDNSSSTSSESAPAPAEDNSSYSEPSYDSSSSDDSSSSYDDSASYDSSSSSSTSSSSATVSKAPASSVPSNKGASDVTVGITGGQRFRIVTSADHMAYQIYHCGISRASFKVTDADNNAVAFSSVALEKGDDNLWYLNVTFANGVDTTGFSVKVTKGDATYLSTELGVSGIKINGVAALSTVPVTE